MSLPFLYSLGAATAALDMHQIASLESGSRTFVVWTGLGTRVGQPNPKTTVRSNYSRARGHAARDKRRLIGD